MTPPPAGPWSSTHKRGVTEYVADAASERRDDVIETHFRSDFLAGHLERELADGDSPRGSSPMAHQSSHAIRGDSSCSLICSHGSWKALGADPSLLFDTAADTQITPVTQNS